MIHRHKYLFLVLAAIIILPISSSAFGIDPNVDCPKKKKVEEDTLDLYESENKVPQEFQIQSVPTKKPVVNRTPDKVAYKTFDTDLEDTNKVGEDDPNSAMSFNFIYYIIDKFKFTDPLE